MKTKSPYLLIVLSLFAGLYQAAAQGTAFTYQGQLSANGGPANGSYDLRFAIFDSADAENQIGNPLTNSATPVSAGLFSVTLDFGTGVFTGPARWLEVGVRSNATGAFTMLNPLQPLTPTPYAIAAGNLLGTLPASQLPSGVVTNNQSGVNINGNITGNGSGLTNTPGTVVWQVPSTTSLQAHPNTSYLLTNNQQVVTLTLPSTPNLGDVVQVLGTGTAGWILAQNPGQSISTGNPNGYLPFSPLWSQVGAPIQSWNSIASSADGAKLAAGVVSGFIYTSTNAGTNWSQQIVMPYYSWSSIVSSADGTQLAALVSDGYGGVFGSTTYGIYSSIDSGNHWTLDSNAPQTTWTSIACSSDGTKLAAVVYGGGIYTSVNSGISWTCQTTAPVTNWASISSSSDGTKLAALTFGVNGSQSAAPGGLYTSVNSGTNWTLQTSAPVTNWTSIASSSDGTKLAALGGYTLVWFGAYGYYCSGIYTSVNSGTNWTLQTSAPLARWVSIASSADGTKLAALANGGGIYTSANSGTNWTLQTSAPVINNWTSIASSSDGTKLAAVVSGGGIYTTTSSGINWTEQTGGPGPTGYSTTVGTAGFLEGTGGGIELIYAGGGNFIVLNIAPGGNAIYDH